jgi:hypothetical protein
MTKYRRNILPPSSWLKYVTCWICPVVEAGCNEGTTLAHEMWGVSQFQSAYFSKNVVCCWKGTFSYPPFPFAYTGSLFLPPSFVFRCCQNVSWSRFFALHMQTLKMEAERSSETEVSSYKTIRYHSLEDHLKFSSLLNRKLYNTI